MRRLFGLLACGLTIVVVDGCGTGSHAATPSIAPSNKTVTAHASKPSSTSTNVSMQQNVASPSSTGGNTDHVSTAKVTPSVTKTVSTWPKVSVSRIASTPVAFGAAALAADSEGHVYAVGGYTGQASLSSVIQVVPTVASYGRLPVLTHDSAVGFLGGQLTVFGGGQSASYNTVVRVTKGQSSVIAHLSAPLSDATAVPYKWKGMSGVALIGGYDGNLFRKTAEFVSMNGGKLNYTPLFQMPVGLRYTAVAVAGGHIYLVGGKEPHGISNVVYDWNPSDGHLSRLTTLPTPMQKAAVFLDGQYLVVAGGLSSSGKVQDTILAIKRSNGQTHVIGHLPTKLMDMGYTEVGHIGYIAGGFTSEQPMHASKVVYKLQFS